MEIDAHEIAELALDLERAPHRLSRELREVFSNEADALKRDMRRDAMNHRYLPEFARELDKEKIEDLHHVVGFKTRNQGSLAHIIVDPTGGARNAPVYDFYAQFRRRIPPFLDHIARIAGDAALGDWGRS